MKIVSYITDSTIECAPFTWGMTLFSYGCNLHCKMCEGYNYEIVTNKDNITDDAISVIDKNITPLHDCVVFLGGEPTIWGEELIEALKFCKSKGLHTKIFTNGMRPDIVSKINEAKLCDVWSVDFKGLNNIKENFGVDDLDYILYVERTIMDIMSYRLPLEIRTTFFEGNNSEREEIVRKQEDVIRNYKERCNGVYAKYIIQEDIRTLRNGGNKDGNC